MEHKTIIKEMMFQYCSQGKLKKFHDLFTTTNQTVSRVKLNSMTNSKGQTLLYVSSQNGHYKMSIYLLEQGANANQRSEDGSTPTHAAARSCCSNLLKYVVEVGGGDLRLHDLNNLTPVDWLLVLDKHKSKKSVQLLQKWQHITECSLSNQNALPDKTPIYFPHNNNLSLKCHGYGDYLVSKQGGEKGNSLALCSYLPVANSSDITVNYKCSWSYKASPCFEMRTASWKGQDVTVKNRKHGEVFNEDLLVNETNACSQLRHPNLLLLLAVCKQSFFEEMSYKACNILIYERVNYGSLYFLLHCQTNSRSHGTEFLNKQFLFKYLLQTAEALIYIHDKKLVHGAISSHSIHIINKETAKLGDLFTIGHANQIKYMNQDILTLLSRWICPAAFDNKQYNENFDAYSFSLVIAECFTGKLPWSSMSSSTLRYNMEQNKLHYKIPGEIPIDLKNVLHRAISAHKTNKYIFRISDLAFVLRKCSQAGKGEPEWPMPPNDGSVFKSMANSSKENIKGIDVPDSVPITRNKSDNDQFLSLNGTAKEVTNESSTALMTTCVNTLPQEVMDQSLPTYDNVVKKPPTGEEVLGRGKASSGVIFPSDKKVKTDETYSVRKECHQPSKPMSRSLSEPLHKKNKKKASTLPTKTKTSNSIINLNEKNNSPLCSQVQRVQSLLSEISTIFSQQSIDEGEEKDQLDFIAVSPPQSEFVPQYSSITSPNNEKFATAEDEKCLENIDEYADANGSLCERKFSIGSQDLEDIFDGFAKRESFSNNNSKHSSASEEYNTVSSNVNTTQNKSESKPSLEVHYTCLRITDPLIRKFKIPNPAETQSDKLDRMPSTTTEMVSSPPVENCSRGHFNDEDVADRGSFVVKISNSTRLKTEIDVAKINILPDETETTDECESSLSPITGNDFVTCIDESNKKNEESQHEHSIVKEDKLNAGCQTNVTFSKAKAEVHSSLELQAHPDSYKQALQTPNPTASYVAQMSANTALKQYQENKAKFYPQTPSKWPFQKKLQLFQDMRADGIILHKDNHEINNDAQQSLAKKFQHCTGNDQEPITPVLGRTCSLLQNKGVKTSTPLTRSNAILVKQDSKIALSELQKKMEFTISTVQNDTDSKTFDKDTMQSSVVSYKVEFDDKECKPKVQISGSSQTNEDTDKDNKSPAEDNSAFVTAAQKTNEKSCSSTSTSSEFDSEEAHQEDFSEIWSMCYNTSANNSFLNFLVDDLAGSVANSVIKEEVKNLST